MKVGTKIYIDSLKHSRWYLDKWTERDDFPFCRSSCRNDLNGDHTEAKDCIFKSRGRAKLGWKWCISYKGLTVLGKLWEICQDHQEQKSRVNHCHNPSNWHFYKLKEAQTSFFLPQHGQGILLVNTGKERINFSLKQCSSSYYI